MHEEMITLFGILMVSFIIIYVIMYLFKLQNVVVEGLTNKQSSGQSGKAKQYSEKIKSMFVKMQDELLISKYRKDYESSILNLDDFLGLMLIKKVLDVNVTDDDSKIIKDLENINTIKNCKDSLNVTMSFLDKQ